MGAISVSLLQTSGRHLLLVIFIFFFLPSSIFLAPLVVAGRNRRSLISARTCPISVLVPSPPLSSSLKLDEQYHALLAPEPAKKASFSFLKIVGRLFGETLLGAKRSQPPSISLFPDHGRSARI